MVDIAEILRLIISSLVTSIFAYIVLKIMKDDRSLARVFLVVLIANVVTIFLPYISVLGIPLPWYVYLIISIVISLFIYKQGLNITWTRTIILVILTPIIAYLIGILLVFLGLGAILSLNFLT